jgi:hypothetical protein
MFKNGDTASFVGVLFGFACGGVLWPIGFRFLIRLETHSRRFGSSQIFPNNSFVHSFRPEVWPFCLDVIKLFVFNGLRLFM